MVKVKPKPYIDYDRMHSLGYGSDPDAWSPFGVDYPEVLGSVEQESPWEKSANYTVATIGLRFPCTKRESAINMHLMVTSGGKLP
jgi:hypothetical protein